MTGQVQRKMKITNVACPDACALFYDADWHSVATNVYA